MASNATHHRPRTFVVNTPIRDLAEYRQLALLATRLKRHGRVEVNISTLADKSRHEIPAGGSPWHEYAACNPTPAKFFPDEMLAPFLPQEAVEKNRRLLLAKAQILRELDLGAAFWSYEPNFLPEPFFQKYPALRGPRTDHPRRSRKEEFAPCIDAAEAREMTTRMVATLVKHVPELGTYFFKTNDAGPGLCWADWQYIGANGPHRCKSRAVGQRVRDLMNAILRGAEKGGGKLTIHMTGNFTKRELDSIRHELPADTHVKGAGHASIAVSCCADQCYPVRGIFDLIGTLHSLQGLKNSHVRTVFVDLRSFYDRGYERLDTSALILETIDDFLESPAFGSLPLLTRARQLCDRWVGPGHGDQLLEAMVELHEILKYKQAALPRLSPIYGGVSLRYITRPLLVLPERLTPEEEAYFLPHVFNVSHERARTDYLDVHGARLNPHWASIDDIDPRLWAVDALRDRINRLASSFGRLAACGLAPHRDGQPEPSSDGSPHREAVGGDYWKRTAIALRLYANVLRSCANFFAVQIVRDRNQQRFSAGPQQPPARGTTTGHPDLALLNDVMRDELDNAAETASLLRAGGLDLLSHATRPEDEDTFLLGPDVVEQLEKKQELMRRHWLDAEAYFVTPNK